jgi:hypothetical protein
MYEKIEPFYDGFFNIVLKKSWGSQYNNRLTFNLFNSNLLKSKLNSSVERKLLDNEIVFKLKVTKEFVNSSQELDSGSFATIVDLATSVHLCALDKSHRTSVSIELTTKIIKSVKLESIVYLICKVDSISSDYGFSSAELILEEDLSTVATSTHTKFLLNNSIMTTKF